MYLNVEDYPLKTFGRKYRKFPYDVKICKDFLNTNHKKGLILFEYLKFLKICLSQDTI